MTYLSLSLIPTPANNFFSDHFFDRMYGLFNRLAEGRALSGTPPYNLVQKDDLYYELTVNVPGVRENELVVWVQNTQLTITGKCVSVSETSNQNGCTGVSFRMNLH